jgi:hypothetical protein
LDFHKEFDKEVRDKKRTASGVHSKTGKRGYVGKMLLTSDLLKGKAKRDYQGTGKVVKWNMYDQIIDRDEFYSKPEEEQKAIMTHWRSNYTNIEIMKGMGISSNTLTKIIDDLGVPRKPRGGNTRRKGKGQNKKKEVKQAPAQVPTTPAPIPAPKPEGMTFSFNGKYSPEEIISKLERVGLLLDGDNSKFEVNLSIKEVTEED